MVVVLLPLFTPGLLVFTETQSPHGVALFVRMAKTFGRTQICSKFSDEGTDISEARRHSYCIAGIRILARIQIRALSERYSSSTKARGVPLTLTASLLLDHLWLILLRVPFRIPLPIHLSTLQPASHQPNLLLPPLKLLPLPLLILLPLLLTHPPHPHLHHLRHNLAPIHLLQILITKHNQLLIPFIIHTPPLIKVLLTRTQTPALLPKHLLIPNNLQRIRPFVEDVLLGDVLGEDDRSDDLAVVEEIGGAVAGLFGVDVEGDFDKVELGGEEDGEAVRGGALFDAGVGWVGGVGSAGGNAACVGVPAAAGDEGLGGHEEDVGDVFDGGRGRVCLAQRGSRRMFAPERNPKMEIKHRKINNSCCPSSKVVYVKVSYNLNLNRRNSQSPLPSPER